MDMKELVNKLNEASEAYYNGKEIMSNKEFDDLFDQLKQMEEETGIVLANSPTHKVGYEPVESLPKFKHTYPALSLDKTKDIDEFVSKFRKGIEDSLANNNEVVLMYKEDGSTVQAYYKDGKLDKLVTRGNGEVGSIITQNAFIISGLPVELPVKVDMVIRGEAVMSYEEFERINSTLPDDQKYANPRNLASASLTMLDREEVAKRHLMLQTFNLVDITSNIVIDDPEFSDPKIYDSLNTSFCSRLLFLKKLGFNVVPHVVVNVDELSHCVDKMTKEAESYKYPVDGLVAAMDNYEYAHRLQGTEHHPHIMQGYAFKWADETKETTLREIEWSPSRTGLLNPVAIFDPIELEGTTVKRASLHNLSIMRKMRIHVGDRLAVYKSNMIIPFVDENLDYDSEADYDDDFIYDLIGFCPTCGAAAEVKVSAEGIETVYCPNEECPEKLIGKLAHFCSRDCMDIQGMSEETISKLVEAKFIAEYADFFKLDQKPGVSFLPGFGKQSWKKMCEAAEKAKTTDFVHFVTALGIPNIGKGQAKALYKYISEHYDSILPNMPGYNPVGALIYMADTNFDFTRIDGVGAVIAKDLTRWLLTHMKQTDSPEFRVYMMLNFIDKKPSSEAQNVDSIISGESFCITGKLIHHANRQALVDKIESLGGKWIDSVSSKTDYLINNDVTSSSGKNKKAKELNIPIISEEDFLRMIGGM